MQILIGLTGLTAVALLVYYVAILMRGDKQ